MSSLKHIHTYAQMKGRKDYFKCLHPECSHYTSRDLVLEKKSLCTACGGEFILDCENTRMVRPKCLNCRSTRKARAYQLAQELVKKTLTFSVGDGIQSEDNGSTNN